MRGLLVFLSFLALSGFVSADKAKYQPKPAAKLLEGEGATYGGLAGTGFTLTDLRRSADSKKKLERIVIDVGDLQGSPLKGWPGYFHAELKKNPSQLVIDFSQMPNSFVDQKSLAKKLQGSKSILKASMSLDPLDGTLNMTMDLRKNTKAKVYQVSGKSNTSKVVIDLLYE